MPQYSGELTHVEPAALPLYLIALAPFIGAVINAIWGRKLQASAFQADLKKKFHIGSPGVTAVALGAMLVAFALAIVNFVKLVGLPSEQRYLYSFAWQMVRIGSVDLNFSFAMDPLSGLMTLIITGVGSLIHIYAASYMEKEPSYWRFFCYLNLFVFAMLLLVLGDNFVVMFFGWEGVGLCSYLLIGFWYKDYKKASAGMKAFVVNRVGDWGFICGMALLFWGLGGAWLMQGTGEYVPDYMQRFMAVEKVPLAHHGGGHGKAHGENAHAGAGHKAKGAGHKAKGAGHKAKGAGHGNGYGEGVVLAQLRRPKAGRPGHAGHDHAGPGHAGPGHAGPGHARRRGGPGRAGALPRNAGKRANAKRPAKSLKELARSSGASGTLTMTTHPGAKVYFGVSSWEQLQTTKTKPCKGELNANCHAIAPFVRKKIHAGLHTMVIVPGGGAVVTGTGDEAAALRVNVRPGKEMILTAIGPTMTFRELHDQLVIKDSKGQAFVKNKLKRKSAWGIGLITLACLCFFVGATGKSAQIPLYVWLPDAMAGPTPVSALIHAATMVTAGVYMIARMNFLFSLSATACGVIALVGALTALFAATMGFFQYDLKKVLAYSTVSQLGFMFIAVGVGSYWAGVFHLMTHAFFKACLFLAAGSVIHGMHHIIHDEVGSQDMRNMGGLKRVMPKTAKTFAIACMAITAVPPGLAGFWSKDELLWKAWNTQATGFVSGKLIYTMGLLAALGTSFYMWRSYYLTFTGKHQRDDIKDHVHESPGAMTGVLWVLAGLAAFSGIILGISQHVVPLSFLPHEPLLEQWLHPVTAHSAAVIPSGDHTMMYILMAVSVFGALGMWALAKRLYGPGREGWEGWEKSLPGFDVMQNKYYVDEIYASSIVAAFMRLRLVLAEIDRWIVDGIVNGAGVVGRGMARVASLIDKYGVDGAVNGVANATMQAGDKLRQAQTGRVQNYIYGILGGVAFFAIVTYLLG